MTRESKTQADIRLVVAEAGAGLMMRNNSGVLPDERGIPVRFGLANDSKQINEKYKSSDLIGVSRVLVTQEMVGTYVGIFTGLEVKPPEFRGPAGDDRAMAQLKWIDLVRSWGGRGGFARSSEEALEIMRTGKSQW